MLHVKNWQVEPDRQAELMDDPALPASEHLAALDALATINAISCTAGQLTAAVRTILGPAPLTARPLRIVDVACGGGDLTVALALRLARRLAADSSATCPVEVLGIDLSEAKVAVVGATGDIGSAVCRWLSQKTGVGELLLVARQQQRLLDLQESLGGGRILTLEEALPEADVVVWVASLPQTLTIDHGSLRKPCLMIDGGYPKNLDAKVAGEGVHVLKGGIVEFWQDISWQMMEVVEMENPKRQLFACFAEAMLLEFEGIHTNFSWGRNRISIANMELIGEASLRHGFRAIGLNQAPASSGNPDLELAAA